MIFTNISINVQVVLHIASRQSFVKVRSWQTCAECTALIEQFLTYDLEPLFLAPVYNERIRAMYFSPRNGSLIGTVDSCGGSYGISLKSDNANKSKKRDTLIDIIFNSWTKVTGSREEIDKEKNCLFKETVSSPTNRPFYSPIFPENYQFFYFSLLIDFYKTLIMTYLRPMYLMICKNDRTSLDQIDKCLIFLFIFLSFLMFTKYIHFNESNSKSLFSKIEIKICYICIYIDLC